MGKSQCETGLKPESRAVGIKSEQEGARGSSDLRVSELQLKTGARGSSDGGSAVAAANH